MSGQGRQMNTTPPGWYPAPDDQTQLRYFDGHKWTDQTAPAAAVARPRGGMPPWAWILIATGVVFLLVSIVAGVIVFRAAPPIGVDALDSSTSSVEAPSQPQLMPGLTLPAGAKLANEQPGEWEQWIVQAGYSETVDDLRQQLPIGRPYDGLAWCSEFVFAKEVDGESHEFTRWTWGTEADLLSVTASPGAVEKEHAEVMVSREPSDSGCVR
ncbi:hypothetical protein MSMEI_5557 [Mycolicibacterium smegmatis MC2 155]|uniref:DUF2510 domain-containing protein n=2 Tax=Mycolicibacterium smegmatis (strain ATCC 700084 / mc(2)155) TaxID=246196 RepID=I7G8M1_MYCS2|nr:hypothetical protein MSMEI_5557 [Mycolicibacterium smegmatis MC2 155]